MEYSFGCVFRILDLEFTVSILTDFELMRNEIFFELYLLGFDSHFRPIDGIITYSTSPIAHFHIPRKGRKEGRIKRGRLSTVIDISPSKSIREMER